MLTKSRIAVAAGLAALALGAPPALAMPAGPPTAGKTSDPRQLDMHASTVERAGKQQDRGTADARGEYAASLSEDRADSGVPALDARGEFAREPIVPPVVVEVDDPVSGGFDWTAGIIGLAGGIAVSVLAGAAVAGSRRRSFRPSVG
jgi:hypothetical protein